MRRSEVHTGDLLGWSEFRDGPSRPGIALGPIPIHNHYAGKYSRARTPSAKLLVLAPNHYNAQGRAVARQVDALVEESKYAVPRDVIDYIESARKRLEDGETIDHTGAPEHWGWFCVASSLLRGPYPELHSADLRAAETRQKAINEENAREAAHRSALFRALQRLDERDLDRRRVAFHREHKIGGETDPLVLVPLSLLTMLLDDGER